MRLENKKKVNGFVRKNEWFCNLLIYLKQRQTILLFYKIECFLLPLLWLTRDLASNVLYRILICNRNRKIQIWLAIQNKQLNAIHPQM